MNSCNLIYKQTELKRYLTKLFIYIKSHQIVILGQYQDTQ